MPTPKRQLMAEQWNDFSRNCLHPRTHETQKREMKRAFYAGAQAILFKVIHGLTTDADPTPEDLEMMTNVHNELQEFAAAVKEGKA